MFQVRGRVMYQGVPLSKIYYAYALAHFFIMLFAFEAVSLFREVTIPLPSSSGHRVCSMT